MASDMSAVSVGIAEDRTLVGAPPAVTKSLSSTSRGPAPTGVKANSSSATTREETSSVPKQTRDNTPPGQALSLLISVPIVVVFFMYYIIRFHGTRSWTDFKGATLDGELSSALVIAGLSTVFNAMIVAYHYATPSHPKFMMVPLRRFCLMAHILSGTTEIVVSTWAIFGALITPDVQLPLVNLSIAQSVAGFVHCLSAAYQTPIVFGARGFMTPAYTMLIVLHAAVSVLNIAYPGNVALMLDQYLIVCTFTWCRVYYVVFSRYQVAPNHEYSLSIILAGATTLPAIVGPLAILCFGILIGLNFELYRMFNGIASFTSERFQLSLHELHRYHIIDNSSSEEKGAREDDVAEARAFFDDLDVNKDGTLEVNEIQGILLNMKILPAVEREVLRASKAGTLNFSEFYRRVWILRKSASLGVTQDCSKVTSPADRARLVFDTIDGDRSGFIETPELAHLLIEWGCPDHEVSSYFVSLDTDHDGRISFDEFLKNFRPIWSFCFEVLAAAQKENQREHERVLDAAKVA